MLIQRVKRLLYNAGIWIPEGRGIVAPSRVLTRVRRRLPIIQGRRLTGETTPAVVFVNNHAAKYNGGVKLQNLWVKLLRENGTEAYIATPDGTFDRWLVNHQPVISYSEVDRLRATGRRPKIVITWLDIIGLDEVTDHGDFYYFDAELRWTLQFKERLDLYLDTGHIKAIGTHSRYIQSWYMSKYGLTPHLINEWSDDRIFFANASERVLGRVGCMAEGEPDIEVYEILKRRLEGVAESVVPIRGDETDVANAMRKVDVFVGLNQGKHPLWGEGCPRTQQEAMHCGCVVVGFDVKGNREFLSDDFTGVLLPSGDTEALCNAVRLLLQDNTRKEALRTNSMMLAKSFFRSHNKLLPVNRFLGLGPNNVTMSDLSSIHEKPVYLHSMEVPYLSRLARAANNCIVEIGAAFGGSTVVFLLSKPPGAKVYSIDPFVPDSRGGWSADIKQCRLAVEKSLRKMDRQELLNDWTLIKDFSYNVVKTWHNQIDLLLIDGSHAYEDVKQDIEQWSPFLSEEALILLHDSRKDNLEEDPNDMVFSRGWAGPTRLVRELCSSGAFSVIDTCYSITVLRRN